MANVERELAHKNYRAHPIPKPSFLTGRAGTGKTTFLRQLSRGVAQAHGGASATREKEVGMGVLYNFVRQFALYICHIQCFDAVFFLD